VCECCAVLCVAGCGLFNYCWDVEFGRQAGRQAREKRVAGARVGSLFGVVVLSQGEYQCGKLPHVGGTLQCLL
jgi:hypothetical protein